VEKSREGDELEEVGPLVESVELMEGIVEFGFGVVVALVGVEGFRLWSLLGLFLSLRSALSLFLL